MLSRSEAILDHIAATCHCLHCCFHLIVVSASSSLPPLPHHRWHDDGAPDAKDATGFATAAAEVVVGIVAHDMVGRYEPDCFAAERSQGYCHCIKNDGKNNNQHQ
jgi:hypothetical protein